MIAWLPLKMRTVSFLRSDNDHDLQLLMMFNPVTEILTTDADARLMADMLSRVEDSCELLLT